MEMMKDNKQQDQFVYLTHLPALLAPNDVHNIRCVACYVLVAISSIIDDVSTYANPTEQRANLTTASIDASSAHIVVGVEVGVGVAVAVDLVVDASISADACTIVAAGIGVRISVAVDVCVGMLVGPYVGADTVAIDVCLWNRMIIVHFHRHFMR